jgi:hypothetical protein
MFVGLVMAIGGSSDCKPRIEPHSALKAVAIQSAGAQKKAPGS